MTLNSIVLLVAFLMLGINLTDAAIRSEDWFKLGRQSIVRQDFDMAVHYFSNEIRDNPRNVAAYLERAKVYKLKGELTKAAEDKRAAFELDPNYMKRVYKLDRPKPRLLRATQTELSF